ncbi:SRPBCC domain-containing protein [Mesorhizobium sp. J428]|uniref:SRPBCC family protein n=1 Tax=Mesorhizobium sp. J428 TaxID=2898440 RepID=UPI0021511320|nr:SRPBCC domain-containing protein [Mesorhizobium sp. J428]MCR5857784.1 SRPBCC domain-containing protein [Mesorhizobium sp. J428]
MPLAQRIEPDTGHELTITRIYDAPRALVFRMWMEPDHMRVWSCPRGMTIPEATGGTAATGGSFRVVMQSEDGQRYIMRGTYVDVSPIERISFTHQWEEDGWEDNGGLSPLTTVTVRFEEMPGGRTRLTLHQGNFRNAAVRDGHEAGWTESLDKLVEHLETMS